MGRVLEAAHAAVAMPASACGSILQEIGNTWTEICAYGTAVVAIPVTDAAKQTATQLGYGQAARATSTTQAAAGAAVRAAAPGQAVRPSSRGGSPSPVASPAAVTAAGRMGPEPPDPQQPQQN